MSPKVFAVPVLDQWLLYSPLRDLTALVNGATLPLLMEPDAPTGNAPLARLHAYLSSEPPEGPSLKDGPLQPSVVSLIPSRACNLRCLYCGFGGTESPCDAMSAETAVAVVDWGLERVKALGQGTLELHFFGGEPFLAGQVVDVAVHRARARAARQGLEVRLIATTNGVFDERRAGFVGDYFDKIVLSFDGPRKTQDHHRPTSTGGGSFDAVARTARLLADSPVELSLRLCVTQDTVNTLEQTTRWLCTTFQPNAIGFETLRPTPEALSAGLEPPCPYEFAVHYVCAARSAKDCGVQPVYAAASVETPRRSSCPLGNDAVIVHPTGRISGCYLSEQEWQDRGLDLWMGQIDANGQVHIDQASVARLRELVSHKPRCRNCFCRWTCAGSCHVYQSYPGCPETFDEFCIQTRVITACRLLAELGCDALVDDLLGSRTAMEELAQYAPDGLDDR